MKNFQDEHVRNLPDAYRKDTESNNYKILQVEKLAVKNLRQTLEDIDSILDLNNAKGKTLDMYGERVGQPRGVANDTQYLLMIKAKIAQNLSNGTYPSILESICYTLNCEPSQVYIIEKDEPCLVEVTAIPLDAIQKTGMTPTQVNALVKRLLPVGVRIESILYQGTFKFCEGGADYPREVDKTTDAGFASDEIEGGYFGITSGEENEPILPI